MSSPKRVSSYLAGLAAMLLTGLLWHGTAGATVTLTPSTDLATLTPGQNFSLQLATGDTTPQYDGFQIDLTYNADAISYQGATFNPVFTFTAAQSEPAGASGTTTIQNITGGIFLDSVSGANNLAALNFIAAAAGVSPISITGTNGQFLTYLGNLVENPTLNAEAIVTPLPAALPLLASALAGLALVRRRKKG